MFTNQKAQAISLALIKVSVYIKRRSLRDRIEGLAFELLEGVAAKDIPSVLETVDVLASLISFGKSIYEIEPINASMLSKELDNFNLAIRQSAGFEDKREKERVPIKSDADTQQNSNGGNGINSTIRQSAIIEKIRQSGNAAMKDLITLFPDISERTLRYDIQRLCNQGMVKRIGNGGPASYYILGEAANSAEISGSNKELDGSL